MNRYYSQYKAAYLRAFKRMLEQRKIRNIDTDWKSPEDVMKWWLRS